MWRGCVGEVTTEMKIGTNQEQGGIGNLRVEELLWRGWSQLGGLEEATVAWTQRVRGSGRGEAELGEAFWVSQGQRAHMNFSPKSSGEPLLGFK